MDEDSFKRFGSKENIISFFRNHGKICTINIGLYFPEYSVFDFGFFLGVLNVKKKVRITNTLASQKP